MSSLMKVFAPALLLGAALVTTAVADDDDVAQTISVTGMGAVTATVGSSASGARGSPASAWRDSPSSIRHCRQRPAAHGSELSRVPQSGQRPAAPVMAKIMIWKARPPSLRSGTPPFID